MLKKILFICFFIQFQLLHAQEKFTLSGIVNDEKGTALKGASIIIKSTKLSTISDDEGRFYFNSLAKGTYILAISTVGYVTREQELILHKNESINLSLRESSLILSEVDVVGARAGSYRSDIAFGATRSDVLVKNVPVTINTVTRQVIEEQQAVRLNEVIRNIAGVTARPDGFNLYDIFVGRGFTLINSRNYFKDGLRFPKFSNVPLGNLERVEFLKGPASVLYGAVEPGGIMNFVTKQPSTTRQTGLTLRTGSFDFYQAQLDLTGPLNKSKNMRYRLNAQYENMGSFRDKVNGDALHINPIVEADLSKNTTLNVEADYYTNNQVFDFGIVAIGDKPADLPLSTFLSESFTYGNYKNTSFGYTLAHRFNSNWRVRNLFKTYEIDEDRLYFQPQALAADNKTLTRRLANWDADLQFTTLLAELLGNFKTGDLTHKFLFGAEGNRFHNKRTVKGANYASVDIFAPIYKDEMPSTTLVESTNQLQLQLTTGLYIQDIVTLFEDFNLMAGLRWDYSDDETENRITNKTATLYNDGFTPRVGIAYNFIKPLTVFASYSQSFVPQSGQAFNGSAFDPVTSKQNEAGFKLEILNERVLLNASIYQLVRNNLTTPDPVNNGFNIQIGQQRSKGFEFDMTGELTSSWKIITSYAYTDADITRSNNTAAPAGKALPNTPYHQASFWSTYTFKEGKLKGLGAGGGLFYVDKRFGDLQNTFSLPSYNTVDSYLSYQRSNYRIGFNMKNLFNERYFEGANSRLIIRPGMPRSFNLSLSAKI